MRRIRATGSSLFIFFFTGVAALAIALSSSTAQAAPEVDLHDLTWHVHVDLIDAGIGRDLAFWQTTIDEAVATANKLIEGKQGPTDQACCSRLTSSASVVTFGTSGDGLDVVDSETAQNTIPTLGSGNSRAYLVDSITYCGGTSPGSVGCAINPFTCTDSNDDPSLWMYVTVDSFEDGTLPSVIAHERGHNACLGHVSAAPCQLMQAAVFNPSLSACLDAAECASYQSARTQTSSGIDCTCHDDSLGILTDGAICSEVATGVCSGGLCGAATGDAGIHLLSAGDPGDLGGAPEDTLRVSAVAGAWENLGQISGTADDIRASAYARDSDTLYGVIPFAAADDSIVILDSTTGALLSTVATIPNGSDEIVSLAWDPGPTSSPDDDWLYALEVSAGNQSGEILRMSPSPGPLTTTTLGLIGPSAGSFFTGVSAWSGLAFDSQQDKLFIAAGLLGLYEVDLGSCGSVCITTQVAGEFGRENASLAYSPATGRLYLAGTLAYSQMAGPNILTTVYDSIDPLTFSSEATFHLERFTPASLAAVPEPTLVTSITAGALMLALTARGRRNFLD